jgi:hypothetical protein
MHDGGDTNTALQPPRVGKAGTGNGIRIVVLSCRPSKTDFRVPLVTAFRQAGYETRYLNISERTWTDDGAFSRPLSFAQLVVSIRSFARPDKVTLVIDSTNLTHPFLITVLRLVVSRAIWCFDMHDDLLYDSGGIRRLYGRAKQLVRTRTSDIVLVASAAIRERFPRAVHIGNASHTVRTARHQLNLDRLLIMTSIDERFDLELLGAVAAACAGTVFDIYGRFRTIDGVIRQQFENLLARQENIRHHGPYATSDIELLVKRYDVMFAAYRTGIRLTRYIDPLRVYHCLNAGMEVIITDIPAVEDFAAAVHVVRGANDVSETLGLLRTQSEARKNTSEHYRTVTWGDRAGEIIKAAERLPKLRRLVEQGR